MTLVVNLFGQPSCGKSTGAAYIFSQLKMKGINAELITEFAKDKVWEDNSEVFKPDNQCYIFGKQFFKMSRCKNKVEVIITDSPLPLSILYNQSDTLGEEFNKVVMNCFNSFVNINYILERVKPYNPKGRLQTEEESDALIEPLINLMYDRDIFFSTVNGDTEGYDSIVEDILKNLELSNLLDLIHEHNKTIELKNNLNDVIES